MSEPTPSEITVTINGTQIDAQAGEMVIAAADRAGVHIPRFCYHERMSPVGMCRMCLVDIDTGRGPMLQPSCMVPVSDGMSVDTESEDTKRAQEGILEFLLVNHPLDCPVCDKGGNAPFRIKQWPTDRANHGSWKKSATTKNPFQFLTSFI